MPSIAASLTLVAVSIAVTIGFVIAIVVVVASDVAVDTLACNVGAVVAVIAVLLWWLLIQSHPEKKNRSFGVTPTVLLCPCSTDDNYWEVKGQTWKARQPITKR